MYFFFLKKETLTVIIEVVCSRSGDGESEEGFCRGLGFTGVLRKVHLWVVPISFFLLCRSVVNPLQLWIQGFSKGQEGKTPTRFLF